MLKPLFPILMLAVAVAVTGLSACGNRDKRVAFDGVYFKTKAKRVDDDYSEFTVSIASPSASIEGAREAGRYEGTRYCIENAGTSRILWTVGPDTDPAQLRIQDDTLVFRGRCNP